MKDFSAEGIQKPVCQWGKYILKDGDYIEKKKQKFIFLDNMWVVIMQYSPNFLNDPYIYNHKLHHCLK